SPCAWLLLGRSSELADTTPPLSPRGRGAGVRGKGLASVGSLTPNPSPPRGEGRLRFCAPALTHNRRARGIRFHFTPGEIGGRHHAGIRFAQEEGYGRGTGTERRRDM